MEGKLPPKVPVVIKVPMTPYQSAVYSWVRVSERSVLCVAIVAAQRLHPSVVHAFIHPWCTAQVRVRTANDMWDHLKVLLCRDELICGRGQGAARCVSRGILLHQC